MKGDAGQFRRRLAGWFEVEGRDYPWRRTRDPYGILVSEMMLQQTQIATVLGPRRYYENWMERFPDAAALAGAGEDEVLKAWEGLGYYSRARNLQRAARMVGEEFGGVFPRAVEEILRLPGVGRYTAGAVASFAYDAREPIVDGNIVRVLARLFEYREPVDSAAGKEQIWLWAEELLPKRGGARVHNSALMELGQRICAAKEPRCGECPVAKFCRAKNGKKLEELPVKAARRKTEHVDEHVVWVERGGRDRDGEEVLVSKEKAGRRREGLWRLPERSAEETARLPLMFRFKYSITHYRVTLHVWRGDGDSARDGDEWVRLDELESLAMGSPYRKAVERVLTNSARGLELEGDLL